mgnify:CR=1 FL=1
MKKEQVNLYSQELDRLRDFFDGRESFTQNEIIDWIAECTAIFTNIGVNESVISKFLEFFSIKSKEVEFEYDPLYNYMHPKKDKYSVTVKTIGSFEQSISVSGVGAFMENYASDLYVLKGGLYYAKVAYSTAKAILQRELDEERLVPQWLINSFSTKDTYTSLFSSLELMESNYQDQDTDGIIKNSLSLLDSLLQIDPIFKKKRDLGARLQCLVDNQQCRGAFGISRDLACALNNSKVIRNEKSVHKAILPLQYNIPFLVAVSFAYLTIYFLEVASASGKIANNLPSKKNLKSSKTALTWARRAKFLPRTVP